MVINAKNKIATVKQLPYDAEIEYLESTGTQWIDTGVYPSNNISIKANLALLTSSEQFTWMIYGGRQQGSGNGGIALFWTIKNIWSYGWGTSLGPFSINIETNTFHIIEDSKNGLILDGINLGKRVSGSVTEENYPICFFAGNNGTQGMDTRKAPLKCKNFQIYSETLLVRSFIPVRFTNELGQSEGAMYDKVSGQLFRNQGSGSFVMGPDVIPYDAEVEYLESTGTQWINTGFYPDGNTQVEIKLATTYDNTTSDYGNFFFGAYDSMSLRFDSAYVYITTRKALIFYLYIRQTTTGWPSWTSNTSGYSYFKNPHTLLLKAPKPLVDGVEISLSGAENQTGSTKVSKPALLFSSNGAHIAVHPFVGVIFYTKIYDNGILIRDFIPVRVGQTGYMYDRANPKGGPLGNGLYPNSGSGNFILGKDVAYPKRKFEVTFRKPNIWIKPKTYVPLWNESSGTAGGNSALNPRGLTGVSLCGWVYVKSSATNATFFGWQSTGSWGGLSIGMWNNSYYFRGGNNSRNINNTRFTTGVWNHIGLTWSTSSFVVYLNGNILASVTNSASSIGSNVSTTFRCVGGNAYSDNDAVNIYQKGMALYNVCGFKRALTEQEMLSIYSSGDSFKNTNLYKELWFGFDFREIKNGAFTNIVQNEPGLTVTNPSDVGKENVLFELP